MTLVERSDRAGHESTDAARRRILWLVAILELAILIFTRTLGREVNDGLAPSGQVAFFAAFVVLLVLTDRGYYAARWVLLGLTIAFCTVLAGALANQPSWYLLGLTVCVTLQTGLLLNRSVEWPTRR